VYNSRFYALKVLKKKQIVQSNQVEHVNEEKRILEQIRHPFLVKTWGTFQDPSNLYIVMDYVVGGELFSVLRRMQVRKKRATEGNLIAYKKNEENWTDSLYFRNKLFSASPIQ